MKEAEALLLFAVASLFSPFYEQLADARKRAGEAVVELLVGILGLAKSEVEVVPSLDLMGVECGECRRKEWLNRCARLLFTVLIYLMSSILYCMLFTI
jgi:hypothetical protein